MKYRAAVIGCGRIGFGFDRDPKRKHVATHAGAYNFAKGVELEAVCDINKKALEECARRWHVRGAYTNFKKMLKKEKIDILSICTPPETHYSMLKEAVESPLKAIFCEKPLAVNVKDAEEMVRLCRKKGIILQVDHQRRFCPLHENIRDFIRKKKFRDVQQVNFYYTAGVRNTGSHMFDLLRFFFGDVEWIEAFLSKNISGKETDPNLDGMLRFKNGVFATFQACDVKKYLIFELNCLFEEGRIIIKNSGFSVDVYKTGESRYYSGYKELEKEKDVFKADIKREFMVNAVNHLVYCVKKGKESISSGEDGLAAVKLIESAVYSAERGGERVYG